MIKIIKLNKKLSRDSLDCKVWKKSTAVQTVPFSNKDGYEYFDELKETTEMSLHSNIEFGLTAYKDAKSYNDVKNNYNNYDKDQNLNVQIALPSYDALYQWDMIYNPSWF